MFKFGTSTFADVDNSIFDTALYLSMHRSFPGEEGEATGSITFVFRTRIHKDPKVTCKKPPGEKLG